MELTFLGTGGSVGMPLPALDHTWLDLEDKRNWRTRSSIHVEMNGLHIQVDAGPECRLQCVWQKIPQVDIVIITHEHSDHVAGLDDLRRYCTLKDGAALPLYSSPKGKERVETVYPYAICERPAQHGYLAVQTELMPSTLVKPEGKIHSTLLPHGKTEVLGLVFEDTHTNKRIAYYTDCHAVPDEAIELAHGADILILDALRYKPHPAHLTIEQAIEVSKRIAPQKTFFTHFAPPINHATLESELPDDIFAAYDGLRASV